MENFLSRLNRNPYAPIDSASITRVDELDNGYDDWNNLIAPKFEAPQQTWGETALGVLTAPQRLAGALYDSITPYQFPQTTSTPMNRAGAGQPIAGGDPTGGGWQVPPVAQEGWNALTAVGDAYNYGMDQDEINSRALGMAGFIMGGGGLAARPTVRAAPAQIAAKSEMDIAMENLRRAVDDDLGDKSPYWNRPIEPRDLTLYHGTGSEFDRFNTPDVWASDSADMASNWAMRKDNSSVIPLEVKGARITRPKDQTLDPEAERARALAEGYDAIDWGKFDGGHYYQLVRPGTVKSPTTGETLFSNASKEGAVPALASALDMSPEARLARARDMGFDTDRTLYHGTDKEFDAFAPSSDGSLGSGVYLTPSEAYAGKYGQNILETYVRGNILDETDVPASVSRGLSGPWKRNRTPATAVADWARANGYDGIRQEGFQTVVFDPKNIRSVNAAFDPAKSDSANLLAANADSKPALLAGMAGQEQKGITAYHGSPHDFDKFDLSKIGTGEGAQAYGHGLYFAENEGVARSYRDNLGGGDLYIKGEKQPFVGAGYAQDTVNRQLMRNHGNVEETLNWLNSEIDTLQRRGVDEDTLGEFLAARDNLSGAAAENAVKFDQGGKMYQVRINADPNDFLDWDKTIADQPKNVQQLMRYVGSDTGESLDDLLAGDWVKTYANSGMADPTSEALESMLKRKGVPGIKYLDQMSRNAGDGTSNYVVFDDSLIEILKKYGWLVPGAGYGGNALMQAQDNQY